MSSRIRWSGLALAMTMVVALLGAHARGDDAEKPKADGDLKAIQGRWTTPNEDSKWEFDGPTMKATVNDMDYKCKVKLDPKADPLPAIDFIISEGPNDAQGLTALGVYKLDGDKLTICVAIPGNNPRPTELKAVENESYLFELKRIK